MKNNKFTKSPVRSASFSLRKCLFLLFLFMGSAVSWAQNLITVKGNVKDTKGEPIIGASVLVKGTATGMITDLDGNFQLQADSKGVLVISFIGYKTQEVGVAPSIQLVLEEDTEVLDEVVVVGYGTMKKSDLTGAVAVVDDKILSSKPVENAFQALQGKVAGVDISVSQRPGELGSILIRGKRSINATNDPLYVVDGVPLSSGGIEALNPRDIENINVLKDASSTAIYGSRGANGVVLITTKRGKNGKLQLSYNGSLTIENIHDDAPIMSAADNITWRRWAFYNLNPERYPRGDRPSQEADAEIFGDVDKYTLANVMRGWEGGSWDPSKVVDTDWTGIVSRTGFTHEHTLRASGGSDKMKTSFAFGYLSNEGTQKGQSYERYNVAMTTDITPVLWLSMGGSINASLSDQDYGMSSWGQIANVANDLYSMAKILHRYAAPYDENGEPIVTPGVTGTNCTVIDEWNKSKLNYRTVRILGSFYANLDFGKMWEPLKGLSYKINFGPDYRNRRDGRFASDESASRKGQLNLANLDTSRRLTWTLDNQVMYTKDFGKHHFDVTFVQSAMKYHAESTSQRANGIPLDKFLWNNMGSVNFTASIENTMGSDVSDKTMASYLGRINYAFSDRYMLTVSGRYDGASQLAEGNKWSFFPSAAFAWRMKEEAFLEDVRWLNNLKLRLGLGVVGNSAIGSYETLGAVKQYYVPFGGVSDVAAYAPSGLMANPSLTWEKTTQYNYGVDFGLFQNRIFGSLDLYNSRTTNLLLKANLPTLIGYSQTWANVGETRNFGVELSLNAIPVRVGDFEWVTTLNAAYQKEKIELLENGKQDMVSSNLFIGQPISVLYGYDNAGLWTDSPEDLAEMEKFNANGYNFAPGFVKPVDQNGDYKFDKDHDYVILGNKTPHYTLGWSNTFSWKGLELAIELYGRMGYKVSVLSESQSGRSAQRQIDYWTPDNTDAEYQKPVYNENGSSGDAFSGLLANRDAAFIKVRNVSIGYVFPEKICKAFGSSNLKVYAQLKNPGNIYSSVKRYDLDMGSTYYNRGVIFGIQVDF